MKNLTILLLSVFLLASCELFRDKAVRIESLSDMECKSGGSDLLKSDTPGSDQTCVEYSFDQDSTLTIMHYNAGFNCCPGAILTNVSVDGDSLVIIEKGREVGCKCNCLFHVEMKVYNLKPKVYHVRFDEDLVVPDSLRLVFDIDLKHETSGSECVTRTSYPWGR